jgi:hypothetical protein
MAREATEMIIECVLMTVSACQLAKTRIEYTLALIGPRDIATVYIESEQAWQRDRNAANTETAYTIQETSTTYIRGNYVVTADLKRLERTIRHENGHLVCHCQDELKATRAGDP